MYDIVFLSYHEFSADEHWGLLKKQFPRAVRVDGIDGIVAAHQTAANRCRTKYFWVVDADNIITDPSVLEFKWDRRDEHSDRVAVWSARNNVNELHYGYGGVKLLPRRAVLNIATTVLDFTTSISNHFHSMPEVASVTVINSTPFEAWKAGFRECTKLASGAIHRGNSVDNDERMKTWMTTASEIPNASYCIRGAKEGCYYGSDYADDPAALAKINNWGWLHGRFNS